LIRDAERVRAALVAALAFALLAGTTAAFAVSAVLKLERSPVAAPQFTKHFSPGCDCPSHAAVLSLRLRKADTIDAGIVDRDGDVVRTLVENDPRRRGELTLLWNGRDDAGVVVPDGRYRLRLRLDGAHRTIVVPNPIFVDTEPPSVRLLDVAPRVFSPDGDGESDAIRAAYTATEPARASLLVDGAPAMTGKLRRQGRTSVMWNGAQLDRPLPPGTYDVALRVTDRAGNVSEPTEAVDVRIRYVEIVARSLRVPRGGVLRFGVDTDARRFSWSLRGRGRTLSRSGARADERVAVALPARLRPGRYVLRATAAGHSAQVVVRIVRRAR
jgi:hypothetical protein